MEGLAAGQLGALMAMAVAAVFTPGPNNAMLSASGAAFGFRRTLPHALGVALGFPLMVFAVALGLGRAFQESELLREALRWGGAALLLWIAWRIARSGGPAGGKRRPRPFRFWEAAAFQWINPKAWVMCVGVIAQFVDGAAPFADALTAAAAFAAAGMCSSHAWAGFGAAMGRWLGDGPRLRLFNAAMAALLLVGVFALLTEDLSPAP